MSMRGHTPNPSQEGNRNTSPFQEGNRNKSLSQEGNRNTSPSQEGMPSPLIFLMTGQIRVKDIDFEIEDEKVK